MELTVVIRKTLMWWQYLSVPCAECGTKNCIDYQHIINYCKKTTTKENKP